MGSESGIRRRGGGRGTRRGEGRASYPALGRVNDVVTNNTSNHTPRPRDRTAIYTHATHTNSDDIRMRKRFNCSQRPSNISEERVARRNLDP